MANMKKGKSWKKTKSYFINTICINPLANKKYSVHLEKTKVTYSKRGLLHTVTEAPAHYTQK
jgi:hypothetical protein